uniref:Uncharacterized protein n=1 Tax=Arundo donax TaxID=35708 RepID=A0A0A9GQV5_ARUDO
MQRREREREREREDPAGRRRKPSAFNSEAYLTRHQGGSTPF